MKKIILLTLALILILSAFVGCAPSVPVSQETLPVQSPISSTLPEGNLPTIKVVGDARVDVPPTLAHISFAVRNIGTTAKAASDENANTVKSLTDALLAQGILEEDITTSNYNIYPEYNYDGQSPVITGYSVGTSLTVNTKDVDNVGMYIDAGVAAGGTIDGVSFSLESDDEAYGNAIALASQDAAKKAELLAAAQGMKLGGILSVSEGYSEVSPMEIRGEMMAADAEESTTSISPGDASVYATVTVYYEMSK